jgi:hypothetical protein
MTPLSALAQSAIASIGGPRDLKLRTTLRRDDVHVWTTYLVVHRVYETLVLAPEDLLTALDGAACAQYTERDAAIVGHEDTVTRVQALLAYGKDGGQ